MTRDTRRTRTVLAVLLAVALTLVVLDARSGSGSPLQPIRGAAGDLLGPVERAAAAVVAPVARAVEAVRGLGSAQERITELEQENEALRRDLRDSELARSRSAQLDGLLRLAGIGRYRVVPARVVAVGPVQGMAWTVSLDVGRRDGVRPDLTVVTGDGLVGRVRTVSDTTATVLLVVDPNSSVGARLEGSRALGLVNGAGEGPLELELLDPQTPMAPGDRLVTFGSQDAAPFVPGVPIGEVLRVDSTPGALTKTAEVRPYVDVDALDLVGVVVEPPRRDPRDAILPPRPSPTRAAR